MDTYHVTTATTPLRDARLAPSTSADPEAAVVPADEGATVVVSLAGRAASAPGVPAAVPGGSPVRARRRRWRRSGQGGPAATAAAANRALGVPEQPVIRRWGEPLVRAGGLPTAAQWPRPVEGGVLGSVGPTAVALDELGRITEVNDAWRAAARAGGASLLTTGAGVSYLAVCDMAAGEDADGATDVAEGIRAVLRGDANRFDADYPCGARWYGVRVTSLGAGRGAVVSHHDLTQLKEAELRLQGDDRLRCGSSAESMPIFALVGSDGTVRHVSASTSGLLGLQVGAQIGAGACERLDPADVERAAAAFARVSASPDASERVEVTVADGEGRRRHLDLVVRNLLHVPAVGAIAITGSDVTGERRAQIGRRLEAELAFQALHDPLTGLPNRQMLVDHLGGAVARDARRGSRTAVLVLDVDDFATVNDLIGHTAGDAVLQALANLISSVTREGDIIARIGGDEFAICCEDISDLAEANAVAARMLQVLGAPFRLGAHELTLTVSIGMAVRGTGRNGEALLRDADVAMHAAKLAGKDRVELFDDTLHEEARRRHRVAGELRRALDAGELVTWFQPELDLATGAVFGFEALVRWHHAERGVVPPDEFIGIAEENGLIDVIGAKVLSDACAALARWVEDGHLLTVSVNVSVRQLADPGFATTVRATIESVGVPAGLLCLELTESALMDVPAATEALRALQATGVLIAIDDFGTGWSSLSRLKRFPVDFLKIDREFVAGIGRDAEDDVIVAAVVNLGHSLGLKLIAEGIEDAEQLRLLVELGCEYGQGYLWSRALPEDEATAFIG